MALTAEQVAQGQQLWNEGKTLGEIKAILGVGLYDVTPYATRWWQTHLNEEYEREHGRPE